MSDPFRGKQIHNLLESSNKLTVSDIRDIQADIEDISTDYILPLVNEIITEKDEIFQYLELLNNWDRKMNISSKEATIYAELLFVILDEYRKLIHGNKNYLKPSDFVVLDYISKNEELITFNNKIKRNIFLKKSFLTAISNLKQEFGENTDNWLYANYHQTQMEHLLKIKTFAPSLFPSNGSMYTVNVAKRRLVTHGPSQRHIFHMKKIIEAYTNIAGGQSGRPSSQYFIDQIPDWKNVRHRTVRYVSKESLKNIKQRITIMRSEN
jgi:penicillin G amidase